MHTYETTLKMHHVDAAGRLFFANQFVIAHDAWESCLESQGFGIGKMLIESDFVTPIVHADGDYSAPLKLGDRVVANVTCDRIGKKSFTITCALSTGEGIPVGQVTHVHAVVDKVSGKTIAIPQILMGILKSI